MAVQDPRRVARNEATFRRVNEAIEAGRVTRDGPVAFVCECGHVGCVEVVELTLAEYEAVRADGRRFFIVPGHQIEPEVVVEEHATYAVVAKQGAAADVAERMNPRSAGPGEPA